MHVNNGKILGTVKMPVLDNEAKGNYLAHYCNVHRIDKSEAATIGDGANDLAMLKPLVWALLSQASRYCAIRLPSNSTIQTFAAFYIFKAIPQTISFLDEKIYV